jgi:hypothetical protein
VSKELAGICKYTQRQEERKHYFDVTCSPSSQSCLPWLLHWILQTKLNLEGCCSDNIGTKYSLDSDCSWPQGMF